MSTLNQSIHCLKKTANTAALCHTTPSSSLMACPCFHLLESSARVRIFLSRRSSHLAREQGLGDAHAVWNGDKSSWLCRLTSLGRNITRLTSCDEMHCGWCWSCRQWRRRLGAVGGQRTSSAEADSAPLQLDDGRPPAERTTITRRHSLSSHWYYYYSFSYGWTMLVSNVFHRLYSLHPIGKGVVLAALMCPREHFPIHYVQNGIDRETAATTYPKHDSSSRTVRSLGLQKEFHVERALLCWGADADMPSWIWRTKEPLKRGPSKSN